MAYNRELAERVRALIGDHPALSERKAFGGISFLLHGNLCCGVINDDLVVRVGGEAYDAALQQPFARPMDFTGRPMKGWVFVASGGLSGDEALTAWISAGAKVALALPSKF